MPQLGATNYQRDRIARESTSTIIVPPIQAPTSRTNSDRDISVCLTAWEEAARPLSRGKPFHERRNACRRSRTMVVKRRDCLLRGIPKAGSFSPMDRHGGTPVPLLRCLSRCKCHALAGPVFVELKCCRCDICFVADLTEMTRTKRCLWGATFIDLVSRLANPPAVEFSDGFRRAGRCDVGRRVLAPIWRRGRAEFRESRYAPPRRASAPQTGRGSRSP
jgi:hypothetical protein